MIRPGRDARAGRGDRPVRALHRGPAADRVDPGRARTVGRRARARDRLGADGPSDHDDDQPQDDLRHRRRPAWSAATPSRRPCAAATASGPWSAPTSDTRWLDRWGVEKVPGDLADAEALRRGVDGADWVFNCAAKVGDWGTLEEFRRLNVEALRLLLDAAADAGVERFVHVSSLGVYEGRDHYGTDETDPPGRRLARRLHPLQDRGRGPGPALRHRSAGCPWPSSGPGFIYGERDRTVLPKLLNAPPARAVRLLRLGRAGAQLHLRQEPGPRHLPGRRGPRGRRRGLQPDRRRAASPSGSSSAGSPSWRASKPPRRKIPLWLAWVLAEPAGAAGQAAQGRPSRRWSTRPATSSSA